MKVIEIKYQIHLVFCSLNRNFAIKDGEITPSRQKKKQVSLFCSRLFVTLHPDMKRIVWILLTAMLVACGNDTQKEAEQLLQQANSLFEQKQYDRALTSLDSLRRLYPNSVDMRRQALKLRQNIELKRSQDELALVDSMLQAVSHDYRYQQQKVEKDKQELRATAEELTMLTRTRMRRDSLQTRFDVLCAKIRYIHKKQKEQ